MHRRAHVSHFRRALTSFPVRLAFVDRPYMVLEAGGDTSRDIYLSIYIGQLRSAEGPASSGLCRRPRSLHHRSRSLAS